MHPTPSADLTDGAACSLDGACVQLGDSEELAAGDVDRAASGRGGGCGCGEGKRIEGLVGNEDFFAATLADRDVGDDVVERAVVCFVRDKRS